MALLKRPRLDDEGRLEVDLILEDSDVLKFVNTSYDFNNRVQEGIIRKATEEIWKSKGKDIVKDVMEGVDWPELLRSKVIKKAIAEAGQEGQRY